jgi:hypothetical protein
VEPTSLYTKSKRNVVVISAILFLIVLGQVKLTERTEFLPIAIDSPGYVPHILAAVACFLLYQFWFSWELQRSSSSNLLTVDFFFTGSISLAALITYAFHYLKPLASDFSLSMISIALGALGLAAAFYTRAELTRRKGTIDRLRSTFLRERLFEAGWMLNFNPASDRGTKAISFNEDGTVGEGRNHNEDRWELTGRTLRLIRPDGSLQNAFAYDPTSDRFTRIPDPSAKGLPDQSIYRTATPSQ